MDNGFIILHRKIKDWQWYSDNNARGLFIHLILFANHEKKKWLNTEIERGQIVVGRKELSKTLGISQQSIRTSLTKLKSTNEITIKSTNKYSIITLINYNQYQYKKERLTSKLTSKLTNDQPTTNQQLTTNNNITIKQLNNTIATPSVAQEIPDLLKDKQKHIQIIGLYARAKSIEFVNKQQQSSFIKRNLRPAQDLVGYEIQKIINTLSYLKSNADFKWTLETVGKYIDEDLTKISKPLTEEEIINKALNKTI